MKLTNAQIAIHLDVAEADIRATAERPETGEVVVILTDYRKFVFPLAELAGTKAAKLPLSPDLK